MARINNQTMMFIFVGILVIVGVWCMWEKSKFLPVENSESYANSKQIREEKDIEYVDQSDDAVAEDDFQLLGVPSDQPAFQLGFGMGPGLYGSGRHTSEMVGN